MYVVIYSYRAPHGAVLRGQARVAADSAEAAIAAVAGAQRPGWHIVTIEAGAI